MDTINDVHLQFASYFHDREIAPYLYLLSQKMEEGSDCLYLPEIKEIRKESFPFDLGKYDMSGLEKSDLVASGDTILDKPFVLDKDRLYLQRYFRYEVGLINKIKELVLLGNEKLSERISQLLALKDHLEKLFPSNSEDVNWQKVAACFALLNGFTIITGGPGTGKTTTVSRILELLLLQHPHAKIALAAPTGKAAARMTESLRNVAGSLSENVQDKFASLKPSTIHRLLGTIKNSIYFKHNAGNPLPYDIVIVDECSMIDIALFAKLLDAVGVGTRLILLGDKDQLSSVEVGSLFGDFCKTVTQLNNFSSQKLETVNTILDYNIPSDNLQNDFLRDNIIELKESRRFDKNKGIGKLADAVIQNKQEDLQTLMADGSHDQLAFDHDYSASVWKEFAKDYIEYIEESDIKKALYLFDKQRILCAVREGEHGTYSMNQKIEDYLDSLHKLQRKDTYYENRPIMVLENNYELGLYNGDIGLLRKDEDGIIKAWFLDNDNKESGLKSVLPGLMTKMETVFAMTIHKSQGSEFNKVMVILPDYNRYEHLLTREILYTAITRAKDFVCVVASMQTILESVQHQVQRSSGVSVRL